MRARKRKNADAYGAELLGAYRDPRGTFEITEREDGLVAASAWPPRYFAEYPAWSEREKRAGRMARGHVLDVGCGAGRFALYLQKRGLRVTAIDNSAGAIRVCRLRGVKNARLLSIIEVKRFETGAFDTIMMMGNNFGLFGSRTRTKSLLKDFFRITSAKAQIIAETVDPYHTRDPLHRAYQKANRKRGRMSGQIRLRIRYKNVKGPWMDYLLVSREEMRSLVKGTGWKISRFISDTGPGYTAILAKEHRVIW
jgi:SAM-dependent methyltransferase